MTNKGELVKNLQDNYFNNIIKNKEHVEINLINGLILKGKLVKFDNFSILLDFNGNLNLVYKHSISHILKKNKK
ncbi:MAG: RNA-binding protein Hfq [Alphaproteobacteria bacterium MarineAlpha9_Bin4]|nr:RNA chaperone Hfq [Pelagibacterales bacterium]PPR27596.1 MAG: RNA-binding protein Hfq [Alphaproteobacteria bacterium MarineAlpha9_Bin4]|tara:strand:+ start:247 stop:468 length:222 start_codon:yes stop_codon:yes gene_type:complete